MNFQFEIERLLKVYSSDKQPVVQFRFRKLKAMNDFYSANGYPKPCTRSELSLLPAYFQEAIYDGIDWWVQGAELEHFEIEFEIDCKFHNSGKMRKDLDAKEFADYVNFSDDAIKTIIKKPKSTFLSRLLAKIGLKFQ